MTLFASVVVPAYNAETTLAECLKSLDQLDYPRDHYEVIVVDNASADRTAEIARGFPVKLVTEQQQGAASARNRGVREATGEIIAFIDSDCVVDPLWLQMLLRRFESPQVNVCGGRLDAWQPTSNVERYIVLRRILDQEKMLQGTRPFALPFIVTANAAFRRLVFEKVGFFDETLNVPGVAHGEDADLCWRIQWAGFRLDYEPNAVVYHCYGKTTSALFNQCFRYGFGTAALFARHRKRLGKCCLIDVHPYVWTLKALLKIPYAYVATRDPFERSVPVYDLVSNGALIMGKLYGSWRWRTLVV
jgi:cellulose synthase/poly-beta-1,6-N-acetylglucosamine synthase-like glycosyltransferase